METDQQAPSPPLSGAKKKASSKKRSKRASKRASKASPDTSKPLKASLRKRKIVFIERLPCISKMPCLPEDSEVDIPISRGHRESSSGLTTLDLVKLCMLPEWKSLVRVLLCFVDQQLEHAEETTCPLLLTVVPVFLASYVRQSQSRREEEMSNFKNSIVETIGLQVAKHHEAGHVSISDIFSQIDETLSSPHVANGHENFKEFMVKVLCRMAEHPQLVLLLLNIILDEGVAVVAKIILQLALPPETDVDLIAAFLQHSVSTGDSAKSVSDLSNSVATGDSLQEYPNILCHLDFPRSSRESAYSDRDIDKETASAVAIANNKSDNDAEEGNGLVFFSPVEIQTFTHVG